MNKILLLTFNALILPVLIACQSVEPPSHHSLLKPGDEISGMVITTGTAQAYPLWIFCSPPQENNDIVFEDCQVPPGMRLAIFHTFGAVDRALQTSDWPELTWTLSLDGERVDLPSFGTLDFVTPGLANHPSPVRLQSVIFAYGAPAGFVLMFNRYFPSFLQSNLPTVSNANNVELHTRLNGMELRILCFEVFPGKVPMHNSAPVV